MTRTGGRGEGEAALEQEEARSRAGGEGWRRPTVSHALGLGAAALPLEVRVSRYTCASYPRRRQRGGLRMPCPWALVHVLARQVKQDFPKPNKINSH